MLWCDLQASFSSVVVNVGLHCKKNRFPKTETMEIKFAVGTSRQVRVVITRNR